MSMADLDGLWEILAPDGNGYKENTTDPGNKMCGWR